MDCYSWKVSKYAKILFLTVDRKVENLINKTKLVEIHGQLRNFTGFHGRVSFFMDDFKENVTAVKS